MEGKETGVILDIRGLTVEFGERGDPVIPVRDLSLHLRRGRSFTLLGESGSGKSTLALAIMGLLRWVGGRIMSGTITFEGENLFQVRRSREIRGGRMGMIFQDPFSALNPSMRVGDQVMEPLIAHGRAGREEAKEMAMDLLYRVGIPEYRKRFHDYPHQFSGGMRQRVMIAIAISLDPPLLIADEPTTALDPTIQAQILLLLKSLRETGKTLFLITHNFAVAGAIGTDCGVMYHGRIVENAPILTIMKEPLHPYTKGLIRVASQERAGRRMRGIPGSPPSPKIYERGCSFLPRCPEALPLCRDWEFRTFTLDEGRFVACARYGKG